MVRPAFYIVRTSNGMRQAGSLREARRLAKPMVPYLTDVSIFAHYREDDEDGIRYRTELVEVVHKLLFQETLKTEPFWMLVACILCNRTKWTKAEPVFNQLRCEFKRPTSFDFSKREKLFKILKPLGFGWVKSGSIIKLAYEWQVWTHGIYHLKSEDILKFPGCGQYAADSRAIFVQNRPIKPKDKELKAYLKRTKENKR